MAAVYTRSEVAGHNSKQDCWFIIHGKVYDVTDFLDEHPGGDDVLINASGQDASVEFDDIGHSDSAKEMLQTYLVGTVERSEAEAETDGEADTKAGAISSGPDVQYAAKAQPRFEERPSVIGSFFRYMLPLLILGAAFAIRYFRGFETEASTST